MFNKIIAEPMVAYCIIFPTFPPTQHLAGQVAGHVAAHKKRLHFPGSLASWGDSGTEF